MFIKKITNRKEGKIYITYRLVKSMRIDGIPRHISVLDLGSLNDLAQHKHRPLAQRIEELINNQTNMFDNDDIVDKEVEQLAQFHYHRFIKKQLENAPVEMARGERTEMVEVDLNSFETIESKQIGGEWLCLQAFNELGLPTFLANQLGFNQNQVSVSLLALIGRLLHPASERATAKWINENSAALELVGPASGVVDRNRLMDAAITLFKSKDEIEDYLSVTNQYSTKR